MFCEKNPINSVKYFFVYVRHIFPSITLLLIGGEKMLDVFSAAKECTT